MDTTMAKVKVDLSADLKAAAQTAPSGIVSLALFRWEVRAALRRYKAGSRNVTLADRQV
jgi:hypothetical protein